MDNATLIKIYEKYHNSGNHTDYDDSDHEFLLEDELTNFAANIKATGKSRRFSLSPLNTTIAVRASIEQKVAATRPENRGETLLANLLSSTEKLEISVDTLRSALQMDEDSILQFIVHLNEEYKLKESDIPKIIPEQIQEKYNRKLDEIRQIIEDKEMQFTQKMTFIDESCFHEKFKLNATMNDNTDLNVMLTENRKISDTIVEAVHNLAIYTDLA